MEKLKKALKMRLQSSGKVSGAAKDVDGNKVHLGVDIFSDEILEVALETSMSMLSQFDVTSYIDGYDFKLLRKYQELLVQGATIQLLAGQSLLERGREFTLTDSGIKFTPPSVSEILNTQWCFEYQMYMEKIRLLKMK